jgi:hypothetical protein
MIFYGSQIHLFYSIDWSGLSVCPGKQKDMKTPMYTKDTTDAIRSEALSLQIL